MTLSRNARCRALQLPAWNEALSLPRPWDQQWSLRLQQILAYETDLLEYPDLFDGSPVIESKVNALMIDARAEIEKIQEMGGVQTAVENGTMKSALVKSMSERMSRVNSGELTVVGVNRWTEGIASPLLSGEDGGVFRIDPNSARETLISLEETKKNRDATRVRVAINTLIAAARNGTNLMEPSIECAAALVTTGEWAEALRSVFGEYRPPTGVEGQRLYLDDERIKALRIRVEEFTRERGHRPRLIVGKPGLDGHSNGAEMIAVAARHSGFDVVYSGIRLTPDEIVASALDEDADMIGVSLLSGSHLELSQRIMSLLKEAGAAGRIPVVFGGIIPRADYAEMERTGIRRIFTPADYRLIEIMEQLMDILEERPPTIPDSGPPSVSSHEQK